MGKVSQHLQQLAADRASEQQLPGVGEDRSAKANRDYGTDSAIFQPNLPVPVLVNSEPLWQPSWMSSANRVVDRPRVSKSGPFCRNYKELAGVSGPLPADSRDLTVPDIPWCLGTPCDSSPG